MRVESGSVPITSLDQIEPQVESAQFDFLEQELIQGALSRLSTLEYISAILCDGLEFSASRVGRILRISESYVQVLGHRSREKLRSRLREVEGGNFQICCNVSGEGPAWSPPIDSTLRLASPGRHFSVATSGGSPRNVHPLPLPVCMLSEPVESLHRLNFRRNIP
jgi:DNA-binding CsgD family transcriptional regulator